MGLSYTRVTIQEKGIEGIGKLTGNGMSYTQRQLIALSLHKILKDIVRIKIGIQFFCLLFLRAVKRFIAQTIPKFDRTKKPANTTLNQWKIISLNELEEHLCRHSKTQCILLQRIESDGAEPPVKYIRCYIILEISQTIFPFLYRTVLHH